MECNKACVLVLQSSHPLSGYFCNDALHLILNIAAKKDPWFKEHGLHSERILPKFFSMPNATTMNVDLSIDSVILPLPPRELVSMMTDVVGSYSVL